MTSRKVIGGRRRLVALLSLGLLAASTAPRVVDAQGPGGPAGVDILIRAQNRSTGDTPFCGVGGGMVGDRLDADLFMDTNGVVTGTARFENALHQVEIIEIDNLFAFGQGLVAQNLADQNTVAIWMSNTLAPMSTALVNVELPRGCANTQSTFTPGIDKVTMEIKFR
jgi:hypothetical protein